MPAVGLAEFFAEAAVGKGNVVIRIQQADHRRQRLQHVEKPLPFSLYRRFGPLALRDVAGCGKDANRLSLFVAVH